MAKKIQDIKSVNWQLSNTKIGEVAEGIDDIRQCIGTIITTTKGSDPLRPLFGSDIWKYIDQPVTDAVSGISSEIIDCILKWEQRVQITDLFYSIDGSRIDFSLRVKLFESGEITEILFYIDRQKEITPPVIGRAFSGGFNFGFS